MRVAFVIHGWQPHINAGSETMVTTLATALIEAGHTVEMFCQNTPQKPATWTHAGIKATRHVTIPAGDSAIRKWLPDVLVSHHECAARAVDLSRSLGVPSVVLLHNTFWMSEAILKKEPDLAIANAQWTAAKLPMHLAKASMVLTPPVWGKRHATPRTPAATKITIVNLFENKGASLFWQVARAMPRHEFLAVKGGYGTQVLRDLPNVTITENTTDMRTIWKQTRVLLVPSKYESWGMTAVEALASGIPVLASRTPGLMESMQNAARFLPPRNPAMWIRAIKTLDNPRVHAVAAEKALDRSAELDPTADLRRWVDAIETFSHRDACV